MISPRSEVLRFLIYLHKMKYYDISQRHYPLSQSRRRHVAQVLVGLYLYPLAEP